MKDVLRREAVRTAARIRELRKADSLVFALFTDPHAHTLAEEGITDLFDAMEALAKMTAPDGVIALGDNLAVVLGRNNYAKNDEIAGLLSGIFDKTASIWDCPLYPVNGNHDGVGTDFFTPAFWYAVTGKDYDRATAHRDGESAYYYVDFPGLRMICLSLPSDSDLTAVYPTPCWEYGRAQLKWLAHTALACDCPVLLAMHVPFFYEYCGDREKLLGTFNGERAAESTIASLCGWIGDRDVARGIFDAFRSHTAYDNDAWDIHMAPSGKNACLIAALSGHMHNDSFWLPGETRNTGDVESGGVNALPCAQFVVPSANPQVNPDLRGRETVPVTMDIAVVTPSDGTITLVRFGDGADRAWNYR